MILHSTVGMMGLLLLAWLFSEARHRVPWRVVLSGLLLLFVLALALLKIPLVKDFFALLNDGLGALERATQAGTSFVFGYLGGAPAPFAEAGPGSTFILAFRALPLALVISALTSVLFYWRVLPFFVRLFSWLLKKTMGVGGVVGLSTAANVFVGMVEAPMFVRPYLARVSRSELFVIMVGGMASIAGTVLALYAQFLRDVVPDALAHLLIASILSAPAAILIAVIMVPPENDATADEAILASEASSTMDAVTRGTIAGVELLINVVAMLLVLAALVALVNALLGLIPGPGGEALSMQSILGWLLAPLAWLAGIPWAEAKAAGALLGTKTVLNEFIAYIDLSKTAELSERSRLIMTYALCGFANFGSVGIMIGGLGTMGPERREEIVQLGMKSIVAGTLTTCLIGAAVGVIV
ncbi:MAG: NupC/NupG family nucleoside CNT transporter [Burkholderiales bacterium]